MHYATPVVALAATLPLIHGNDSMQPPLIIRFMPDPASMEPAWPDHLDALVAAPAHHRLLFENESVRVIETIIPPGEIVPLHTHRWPGTLHLISWSDIVRRDASSAILMDSRALSIARVEGAITWSPALPPHTLENVGSATFHAITTELKHL